MRTDLKIAAFTSIAILATGCGTTTNYDPATNNDQTAPTVNLLIKRFGAPDLEVQKQVSPSPKTNGNFGNPIPKRKLDFSILATAKDAESGIKTMKLSVTRTVCYVSSSGAIAQAYSGSVERKAVTYTDRTTAPTEASLGDTGIIDNSPFGTDVANLVDTNLLVWKNSNQVRNVGVGVSTKWFMETTNFAGITTYSDVIFILAGDLGCNPP